MALPSFRGPGYSLDPLHLAGRGGSGRGGPHQGCSRPDSHFLHILVSQQNEHKGLGLGADLSTFSLRSECTFSEEDTEL